jgi:hypothetical protein
MNYISRNYGTLLKLMFNTLDRKEVSDEEARNNYKDLLLDYCHFLYRLSDIEMNSNLNQKLNHQKEFVDKLEKLTERYKSINDDAVPNESLEAFLNNVQEHMKHWVNNDLNIDLRNEETKHYNRSAYSLQGPSTPILERRKSDAIDVLMQSSRNKVDFGI